MHRNLTIVQKLSKLEKLEAVCADVRIMLADEPGVRLNNRQRLAIDKVLRTLDFGNHYREGDLLRTAFGVELATVRDPYRRNKY